MDSQWARVRYRDQCVAESVPFFFKQCGASVRKHTDRPHVRPRVLHGIELADGGLQEPVRRSSGRSMIQPRSAAASTSSAGNSLQTVLHRTSGAHLLPEVDSWTSGHAQHRVFDVPVGEFAGALLAFKQRLRSRTIGSSTSLEARDSYSSARPQHSRIGRPARLPQLDEPAMPFHGRCVGRKGRRADHGPELNIRPRNVKADFASPSHQSGDSSTRRGIARRRLAVEDTGLSADLTLLVGFSLARHSRP